MVGLSDDVEWEGFVPVGSALGVRRGALAVMCLCWSCRARGAGTSSVTGRVMLKMYRRCVSNWTKSDLKGNLVKIVDLTWRHFIDPFYLCGISSWR